MMPTASAILSDVVDLARNLRFNAVGRIPPAAWQPAQLRPIAIMPITRVVTSYYFRFAVLDRPGVLSAIAGILGNNAISIKSVHQKGRKTNGTVPIVMLSHPALEADVQKALREIADLEVVGAAPVLIRIEQDDSEDMAQ